MFYSTVLCITAVLPSLAKGLGHLFFFFVISLGLVSFGVPNVKNHLKIIKG